VAIVLSIGTVCKKAIIDLLSLTHLKSLKTFILHYLAAGGTLLKQTLTANIFPCWITHGKRLVRALILNRSLARESRMMLTSKIQTNFVLWQCVWPPAVRCTIFCPRMLNDSRLSNVHFDELVSIYNSGRWIGQGWCYLILIETYYTFIPRLRFIAVWTIEKRCAFYPIMISGTNYRCLRPNAFWQTTEAFWILSRMQTYFRRIKLRVSPKYAIIEKEHIFVLADTHVFHSPNAGLRMLWWITTNHWWWCLEKIQVG